MKNGPHARLSSVKCFSLIVVQLLMAANKLRPSILDPLTAAARLVGQCGLLGERFCLKRAEAEVEELFERSIKAAL